MKIYHLATLISIDRLGRKERATKKPWRHFSELPNTLAAWRSEFIGLEMQWYRVKISRNLYFLPLHPHICM
jgi:hypothetical protein